MDLYHFPANLFVAGLIGSPKMNFLAATLVSASAQRTVVRLANGQERTIAVDAADVEHGSSVTVGVRPEHLRLGDGENPLPISIDYVECLGDATFLYAQAGGAAGGLIWRAPADLVAQANDHLVLNAPSDACHLFDKNGRAFRRNFRFEQRAVM